MSLEHDLDRAIRRASRAARIGGHDPSVYHPSPVERIAYTSFCLNKGCRAVVGITSTMDVIGDGAWTRCAGDDPYAAEFDAPSAEGEERVLL